MFHLHRPDVLAVGDLGIRKAVKELYGLDPLPAPAALEALAEPWRPYRTLACLYLWRSLEPGAQVWRPERRSPRILSRVQRIRAGRNLCSR